LPLPYWGNDAAAGCLYECAESDRSARHGGYAGEESSLGADRFR